MIKRATVPSIKDLLPGLYRQRERHIGRKTSTMFF